MDLNRLASLIESATNTIEILEKEERSLRAAEAARKAEETKKSQEINQAWARHSALLEKEQDLKEARKALLVNEEAITEDYEAKKKAFEETTTTKVRVTRALGAAAQEIRLGQEMVERAATALEKVLPKRDLATIKEAMKTLERRMDCLEEDISRHEFLIGEARMAVQEAFKAEKEYLAASARYRAITRPDRVTLRVCITLS